MQVGFYAGSFDPFTNGHLHVVEQSAKLFDKLVIGIGVHPEKERRFDKELMKEAIEKVIARKNLDNVTVITYDNLSIDVAVEYGSTFLVRGIRNGMDYEYEENTAGIQSAEALQMTVFPNPAHGFVSLKGLDGKYATVNVVDVLGKNVMKCIVSPESGLMDVRTLTPGLYILHVATVDGVASVRLVIE